ncbi:MAG: alpha-amylase [Saprospiraceae bacterium]|nr:alpha-amylase [Saprospiraceae bacterium]
MYQTELHQKVNQLLLESKLDISGVDNPFYLRCIANASDLYQRYNAIYDNHLRSEKNFEKLLQTIIHAYKIREDKLKSIDLKKEDEGNWILSNKICGMSFYVDRFSKNLKTLSTKLDYFKELGVNFLHLMPIMQSPEGANDGGYAVSDFRKVDKKFGTLADLISLRDKMLDNRMFLMLDIVLNHTSDQHEWAMKAKSGDRAYQDYFYMFEDRTIPDEYDRSMPEIFPEHAPGNFTWSEECSKWVMTVFNNYQWDLNYTNPAVLVEMVDNILFYANLGVDVIRVDAPAFIWKKPGTNCQNLPESHTLLQLIKCCVQIATPGMAILGEAIVAPKEIMKYFGTDENAGKECDIAYNATHMALQWDALATGDTTVMIKSQHDLMQKPLGTTWITYTRCHDDIGLGFEDEAILEAGYSPYQHRRFLKNYYSGQYADSPAKGALFGVNPKTQDARISGSLASLCGLEYAIEHQNQELIDQSVQKILLMQAHSMLISGIPMLFYGDELGYTNDYSYQNDESKSSDNRWMHRPLMEWKRNENRLKPSTLENRIFEATQKLISIRKSLPMVADHKNLYWVHTFNKHTAIYLRELDGRKLFCIFNFSKDPTTITWYAFNQNGDKSETYKDYWTGNVITSGSDHEYILLEPYAFQIMEAM